MVGCGAIYLYLVRCGSMALYISTRDSVVDYGAVDL